MPVTGLWAPRGAGPAVQGARRGGRDRLGLGPGDRGRWVFGTDGDGRGCVSERASASFIICEEHVRILTQQLGSSWGKKERYTSSSESAADWEIHWHPLVLFYKLQSRGRSMYKLHVIMLIIMLIIRTKLIVSNSQYLRVWTR